MCMTLWILEDWFTLIIMYIRGNFIWWSSFNSTYRIRARVSDSKPNGITSLSMVVCCYWCCHDLLKQCWRYIHISSSHSRHLDRERLSKLSCLGRFRNIIQILVMNRLLLYLSDERRANTHIYIPRSSSSRHCSRVSIIPRLRPLSPGFMQNFLR